MAADKKKRRRLIAGVGAAALLFLLAGIYFAGWLGGVEEGVVVETAQAERRTITQVVTASGKAQPEVEVKISPDVSGEITQLPVQEGERVTEGDLLARIKPDVYEAQVEQAQAGVLQAKANLEQAKADLAQAKQQLERKKALYEQEAISREEYETAKIQHEVAQAGRDAAKYRLASAQASFNQSEEQLQKTSIFAPMTGTVSRLDVEQGERVVGTSQMAGTEMMRIALLNQMEMEVDVNENDIVNVSERDSARVEIDAYPEQAFRGVVTEIANSARVSNEGTQQQVTNFPVKVRIQEIQQVSARPDTTSQAQAAEEVPPLLPQRRRLRPGMSGTVDIFTETAHQVVSVPIQAVTVRDVNAYPDSVDTPEQKRPEKLRKVVFTIREGKAHMREVETGIADDTHIAIRSGLEGGETIITGPYRLVSRELKPGMAVNVNKEPGPAQEAGV